MNNFKKYSSKVDEPLPFDILLKELIQEKTDWKKHIPQKTVIDNLEQYKNDPTIFISMQGTLAPTNPIRKDRDTSYSQKRKNLNVHDTKIGVNPHSPWNTPLGVYTYPVKRYWDNISKWDLPYQATEPFVYVLRKNGNQKSLVMDGSYTNAQLKRDVSKLLRIWRKEMFKYNPDDEENIHKFKVLYRVAKDDAKKKTPDGYLWNFTRLLSEKYGNTKREKLDEKNTTSKFNYPKVKIATKPSVAWNMFMRALGYGSAEDYGTSLIHPNEPTQAVFFTRKSYDVVDRLINKHYVPVETYIDKIKNFDSETQDKILQKQPYLIFKYPEKFDAGKVDYVIKQLLEDKIKITDILGYFEIDDLVRLLIKHIGYIGFNKSKIKNTLLKYIEENSYAKERYILALITHFTSISEEIPENILVLAKKSEDTSILITLMKYYNYDFEKFSSNMLYQLKWSGPLLNNFFDHYQYDISKLPEKIVEDLLVEISSGTGVVYRLIATALENKVEVPEFFWKKYVEPNGETASLLLTNYYMEKGKNINISDIPVSILIGLSTDAYYARDLLKFDYDLEDTPEIILKALAGDISRAQIFINKWMEQKKPLNKIPTIMLESVKDSTDDCVSIIVDAIKEGYTYEDIPETILNTVKSSFRAVLDLYDGTEDKANIPHSIIKHHVDNPTFCVRLCRRLYFDFGRLQSMYPDMVDDIIDSLASSVDFSISVALHSMKEDGSFEHIPYKIKNSVLNADPRQAYSFAEGVDFNRKLIPPKLIEAIAQSADVSKKYASAVDYDIHRLPIEIYDQIKNFPDVLYNIASGVLFNYTEVSREVYDGANDFYYTKYNDFIDWQNQPEEEKIKQKILTPERIEKIAKSTELSVNFARKVSYNTDRIPKPILDTIKKDGASAYRLARAADFDYNRVDEEIYNVADDYHYKQYSTELVWKNLPQEILDKKAVEDEKTTYSISYDDTKMWKDNKGRYHRLDGPALIYPNGAEYWYKHGKKHRLDGPAHTTHNGDEHWYVEGLPHREGGPAITRKDGSQEWWLNGIRHRGDGGPAYDDGENQTWYVMGELHRLDGPAAVYANGTKEWYQNGDLHREDGPAIMRYDGKNSWYIKGESYTEEEFNEYINKGKPKQQESYDPITRNLFYHIYENIKVN
jgi:hypothetical protein